MSTNTIPQPVSPGECPLLAKYGGAAAAGLIDRYAAALDQVRALQADPKLAPLLPSGRLADTLARLADARDLLTRARYVVGFIGVSQAGKSTAVNNLLGEEVCKAGALDSMSSQPARIVKAAARSIDLEYLTPAAVQARRQKLCEAVGLPSPGDDREVLDLLSRPADLRTPDGLQPPRFRDDAEYLRKFLTAAAQSKRLVTDPPHEELGKSFDERFKYTTHTGNAGKEALLLREVRFHLDNPILVDELELCDLPGLDSKRTVDDEVTWEYLSTLHGMFLFVNVGGNLLAEGMLKILARVTRAFGDLGGRAWVIFNKMDSLTTDSFRDGHDTIFTTIRRFLDRVSVPAGQVVFCSSKVWDAAKAAGGEAPRATAATMLSQTAAAPVPPSCPPEFAAAWRELLKDGGVSHIRSLMLGTVAETLAAEIRNDAGRALDDFAVRFKAVVEGERKRQAMNPNDLLAANACQQEVSGVRAELTARPGAFPVFDQEADRVRQLLADAVRLDERAAATFTDQPPAERVKQFALHARVLDQILATEVEGDMIGRAFDAVGQRLDGLPPVPVGPAQQTCREVWARFALEDRGDTSWLTERPAFAAAELGEWLADPDDPIDGAEYVGLMGEKIDAASRQAAHLIRRRVRHRLTELAGMLGLLTGEAG